MIKRKPKAIHLTFKDNFEEDDLYNWICSHTSKNGFIKDVLFKEKRKQERINKKSRFLRMED